MWSSRLFWKLFLAYAGLLLAAVSVSVAVVSSWQEKRVVAQAQQRLRTTAILLRHDASLNLADGPNAAVQEKVRHLGQQIRTRLTLIASDGQVLADSEQSTLEAVASMENHLGRQELVLASRSGEGVSQRISPTLGIAFLYYALRVDREGRRIGFIRTAQPVASIRAEVAAASRLIWLVGLLVGLSGLTVIYWLTKRVIRPVATLTHVAESIAAGNYCQRVDVSQSDELGKLARSFEHMSRQLGARESQLRETAQRQATVLRGMSEGVIAVDGRSQILFANVAAGKVLGFHPEEVEGHPLLEIVRHHQLHDMVQTALHQRPLCSHELQLRGPVALALEVHATPLPGEPCPGVVLVLRDITQLKRLENVRQQFIANVSHELKTPLSSIKAYTETLLCGAM